MKFDDLAIGTVFSFNDGRMSEAETWLPFVKTAQNQATLLVKGGTHPPNFVDTECLGWSFTRKLG